MQILNCTAVFKNIHQMAADNQSDSCSHNTGEFHTHRNMVHLFCDCKIIPSHLLFLHLWPLISSLLVNIMRNSHMMVENINIKILIMYSVFVNKWKTRVVSS